MDKRVVSHVYGALQSLERSHRVVKEKAHLCEQPEQKKAILHLLPQQEEVLRKMKKIANTLQLEVAREDWNSTIRSLRVFYGLNQLVRHDIYAAQRSLTLPQTLSLKSGAVNAKKGNTDGTATEKTPLLH